MKYQILRDLAKISLPTWRRIFVLGPSPELIEHVNACLAAGLGIRGAARVFEIDPYTVLQWLVEAAEQLQAFSAYFLYDLYLNPVQLDELYAILSAVRAER